MKWTGLFLFLFASLCAHHYLSGRNTLHFYEMDHSVSVSLCFSLCPPLLLRSVHSTCLCYVPPFCRFSPPLCVPVLASQAGPTDHALTVSLRPRNRPTLYFYNTDLHFPHLTSRSTLYFRTRPTNLPFPHLTGQFTLNLYNADLQFNGCEHCDCMFQLDNLETVLNGSESTLAPLGSMQATAADNLAAEGERIADAKAVDDVQQGDIDQIAAEIPKLKKRLLVVSNIGITLPLCLSLCRCRCVRLFQSSSLGLCYCLSACLPPLFLSLSSCLSVSLSVCWCLSLFLSSSLRLSLSLPSLSPAPCLESALLKLKH